MIDTILGDKYLIVRRIGSGGMGIVYEATQLDTGQPVAVKVIHASLIALDDDGSMMTRFAREAKTAGEIDSPHIARVLDVGTDPESGCPFMVMEYLVGEDAHDLFERLGPVSPGLALRIVAQACEGLRKAHAAGVVHRDIKPANLFLARGEEGERVVKLLDFGVAKVQEDASESGAQEGLTQTGSMLGSPMYMSPEQARSAREVDHRSDIWSMGMVLYRALAGRTPYQNVRGIGAMVLALYSEPVPLVQQFAPWVSPQITAIVERALRLDPDQRFQSAEEMLAAIRPLLRGGFSIDEAMLEPLSEEARDVVAPAFVRPADGALGEGWAPPLAGRIPSSAPLSARPASLAAPSVGPVSSGKGLELTAVSPTNGRLTPGTPAPLSTPALSDQLGAGAGPGAGARRSSIGPVIAIVLTSIALGGVSFYALTRPVPAPVPGADATGTTEPVATASSAEAADASATPTSAPTVQETASASAPPVASSVSPYRRGGGKLRPGGGKGKDPLRLDHTSFGDRK